MLRRFNMKFNKREITKSVLSKFFLLALFVLIFATQSVQADEIDMNKLDFLQSQAAVIKKVEMPINAISEGKIHPSRPMDAMYASYVRDAVKNKMEAMDQIDKLKKESESKVFHLGSGSEILGQLNALASKYKTDMNGINSYYEGVVDKYKEEAKFAIENNIANAYSVAAIAAGEKRADILGRAKHSVEEFRGAKPAAGDFAGKYITQLRSTIDNTYAGMLTGAITVASLSSRSNVHRSAAMTN